jgi:hypothetical protein
VSGENFVTDGGTLGALMTGRLVLSFDAAENLASENAG